MILKKPEEVLRAVSAELKYQGITHAQAAERIGMQSKQTFSNLLSSKKYLSYKQAERFSKTFGFNVEFLTTGKGQLTKSQDQHQTIEFKPAESVLAAFASELATLGKTGDDSLSQQRDLDMVLAWFREVFSRQGNNEGLAIWAEISRYTQKRIIVSNSMRGYKGDDYEMEFVDRLEQLQSEIINNIDLMIKELKKSS